MVEEKYKIHALYVLTILIAIIVILITVKWSDIPNLSEKISFALTLASLILAALAIAYAVYSNTSLSQNISTLNNASRDVSNTAKDISEAANDLSRKIEAIPSRLESVEVRIAETNALVRAFSDTSGAPPSAKAQRAVTDVAELFRTRGGTGGIMATYICSIAFRKKKAFNLQEVCSNLEIFEHKYALGILLVMDATGLIASTVSNGVYNLIDLNEKLQEVPRTKIEEEILSILKRIKLEQHMNRIIEELNSIEKYFE